MSEVRKSGYYWVNVHSSYGWQIGYYSSFLQQWSFLCTKNAWTDELVIEVDEKELIR